MSDVETERTPLLTHSGATSPVPRREINIIRSSGSQRANMGSPRPVVVIQGDSSWSRRHEIHDRIRRQAEQSGCHVNQVLVTSASYGSLIPSNVSSLTIESLVNPDTDDENDPLAGIRVEAPYHRLITEMRERGNDGSEILRICQRPFQDRRMRSNAIEEGNRHRYNLISRLAGPPLPLPNHEDPDASSFDNDLLAYGDRFLVYPDHLIDYNFFLLHIPAVEETGSDGKQSSIVTILSIWNTMVGTSLLATPWAISRSGLIMGPAVALLTAKIASYTAVCIVKDRVEVEKYQPIHEFAPLAGCVLGRRAEITATLFSLLAVCGASIVYWVLMSNFSYNGIIFIHDKITNHSSLTFPFNDSSSDVICPSKINSVPSSIDDSMLMRNFDTFNPLDKIMMDFHQYWNPTTAPIFLILLIFPLISVKSVTFFTKLNSFGTVSVFFIIGLVIYHSIQWGINVDFHDTDSVHYVPFFKWDFPCFTGMLSLGLFIHNCVITITKNNRHQKHNARDVSIAFSLVTLTYLVVGILFYISFPLSKDCLEDNFLNNFHFNDLSAAITRWLLLFQLMTVFPLIMYILRNQLYLMIFKILEPSRIQMFICNACMVTICVLVAIFYPNIGTIIRFSGSFCGFFLIFCLPVLVHISVTKGKIESNNRVGKAFVFMQCVIIALGLANIIAQFFV